MSSYAFLSYQTADKAAAGGLKKILSKANIKIFLAHEDIDVSVEWRSKILEEIEKTDIFICLLSRNYKKSPWCMQESGIAAFRPEMTIVPLSLDGTKPTGFISSFQAVRVDPANITLLDLIPAFLKHDFDTGIDLAIGVLAKSQSFRSAEENFRCILPYIPKMSNAQVKLVLQRSAENKEIHHATLCARDYLPQLLKSHGRYLSTQTRQFLKSICAQYAIGV